MEIQIYTSKDDTEMVPSRFSKGNLFYLNILKIIENLKEKE